MVSTLKEAKELREKMQQLVAEGKQAPYNVFITREVRYYADIHNTRYALKNDWEFQAIDELIDKPQPTAEVEPSCDVVIQGYIESDLELRKLLAEANGICRSMHAIVERQGKDTNWEAFKAKLENALNNQHKIMFPTNEKKELTEEDVTKIFEEAFKVVEPAIEQGRQSEYPPLNTLIFKDAALQQKPKDVKPNNEALIRGINQCLVMGADGDTLVLMPWVLRDKIITELKKR